MKKYLVLCGDCFYPTGGGADFMRSFSDKEEAVEFSRVWINNYESSGWANVFDAEKEVVVFSQWDHEINIDN